MQEGKENIKKEKITLMGQQHNLKKVKLTSMGQQHHRNYTMHNK